MDESTRLAEEAERKAALIAAADEADARVGNGAAADETLQETSVASALVAKVLDNLQLEISNVHLRWEGQGVSAGLVLESLSLRSCDEEWTARFVAGSSRVHKQGDVRCFGAYLDVDLSLIHI